MSERQAALLELLARVGLQRGYRYTQPGEDWNLRVQRYPGLAWIFQQRRFAASEGR